MATAPKLQPDSSHQPLPESIARHAELQARIAGITPEQWLAEMAALRLDTEEGTEEFFRQRSTNARPGEWRAALAAHSQTTPEAGDELSQNAVPYPDPGMTSQRTNIWPTFHKT